VIEIRHILCPTDFSEASRRALDHAVVLAKWYDSTLTILHVSAVQPVIAFGAGATVLPPVFLTAEERRQLLASMKTSAEAEIGRTVPFDIDLSEGNPVTEILDKVAALPMATWNYKSQDKTIRHMGPMAQDFKAAFELGENDRTITTVDADGVALAAIQGLNQKIDAENKELRSALQSRDATIADLQKRLSQIESILGSLASTRK